MQLAWLLRPEGQNIDRLIDDLNRDRDLPVIEALAKYGPATPGGGTMTGATLLRILDGITGDIFIPKPCKPQNGLDDVRSSYAEDAARVFNLNMTTGQAIERAEKTAKIRLKPARTKPLLRRSGTPA